MEFFKTMKLDYVIRTRGLTRYFGAKRAVYELDLTVPRGGIFAFLGRNGSGKSTAIRMLLGLLEPTRGGGEILGCDITKLSPEIRARIGYLTEEHQLYSWMSVRECEGFQSKFYPKWNKNIFRGVAEHFGLKAEAKVKNLSRGERAGMCLGLTLAPDPELLILDDPALGLDPVARRSLVESMIQLTRRSDRTIFFSTHQLDDMERVADYVAVLDHGVLRACCPLDSFRESVRQVQLRFPSNPPALPEIPGLIHAVRTESAIRIVCVNYDERADRVLQSLNPSEMEISEIRLEDALISYLGRHGEKSFVLSETAQR
jgi:ABC-2 type transport system ATP-binding protein